MDDLGMVDFMLSVFEGRAYDGNAVADVLAFEDADVISDDYGVVVRMEHGEEFQLFVKQTVAAD